VPKKTKTKTKAVKEDKTVMRKALRHINVSRKTSLKRRQVSRSWRESWSIQEEHSRQKE
jgi:hypothetical protein